MLALPLLALLAPSLAAAEQPFPTHPHAMRDSLEISLAAGGIEQPQALSSFLQELGLPTVQDVRLLNVLEQLELAESLRVARVNLGSRSRLRRLSENSSEAIGLVKDKADGSANFRTSHRRCQDELKAAMAEGSGFSSMEVSTEALENARWQVTQPDDFHRQLQQGGGGGGMDSIALAVTALLGIASYLVQAKISRDAEKSQKESDRAHVDRTRAEMKAEQQLARVMTQMERFVAPLNTSMAQLLEALVCTLGEVGLAAQIEHWQLAWLKVPAAPHIEVYHSANPAMVGAMLRSPYFKLAAQDIAVLENDPAARQRCVGSSLGPRHI
jgi:hypothetical protein